MMKTPVLYYTPRSAPCRSVLLTAAAIGLEMDLRLINLQKREHMTPDFLKLNPQHTVPVLDDNGTIITDSHVICAYLVDTYASNDELYPKTNKRREVDASMYYDCGHLFPRVRLMAEPILYFGAKEISKESIVYMQKAYDGLERTLSKSSYLCGDHMTIADLCCIASVSSAVLWAPIDEIAFPNLNAWIKRLSELPYYKTNKEGVEMLDVAIKSALKINNTQVIDSK